MRSLEMWNEDRRRLSTASTAQTKQAAEAAYINTIAIIQSSGTGKSRLLHETATDIFTIPINLRISECERSSTRLWMSPLDTDEVTCASWLSAKRQRTRTMRAARCRWQRFISAVGRHHQIHASYQYRQTNQSRCESAFSQ